MDGNHLSTRLESTRFVAVSGGRDHMVAITDVGTRADMADVVLCWILVLSTW